MPNFSSLGRLEWSGPWVWLKSPSSSYNWRKPVLLKIAIDLCSFCHLWNFWGDFLLVGIKRNGSRLPCWLKKRTDWLTDFVPEVVTQKFNGTDRRIDKPTGKLLNYTWRNKQKSANESSSHLKLYLQIRICSKVSYYLWSSTLHQTEVEL